MYPQKHSLLHHQFSSSRLWECMPVSSCHRCYAACALFLHVPHVSNLFHFSHLPLLLCAGKNLEPQPLSVCVPRVRGSQSQRLESVQVMLTERMSASWKTRDNPVSSKCEHGSSVYLRNDLICLAVSNSIWFYDGNCVGFTGRTYRERQVIYAHW